ncbi:MAG: YCF48-related protein [Actinomycetota bacterium]|nr:YCF48-related protein [Actinomycetota bacterium]
MSVGQSGWSWGSPLPQGNTLRAVELLGGRGYASGAFGTVLRTDDGGGNWSGITTGVTADLTRLRVLGPDSFVVGGGCVLRRSDDGGASFKRLPFSASEASCPAVLSSFSFPVSATGYLLLADGTVTRTDDGGGTFSGRTAVPGTRASGGDSTPADIAFTGPETGVAITAGSQPRIFRTTDGARSWTVVQSSGAGLRSLHFVDATTGYAVGDGSTLFATTDGGETWTRRRLAVDSPPATLTDIRCANRELCLISTGPGDRLFRTTDGGETARAITPSTDPVFAAAFANEARVVGVGAQGTTVISDDGGVKYQPVGGRLPGSYTGVRAASPTVAYALGINGALARTGDGGQTWTPGQVSTSEDVRDVSFPTADTGFALDTGGALLRTDNAGRSWRILNTGASAPPDAVLAPSAETVVLVGPRGVRRSSNGGEEFAPVKGRAVSRAVLAAADRAGSALVAYGPRAVMISSNGGQSWKAIKRPSKRPMRSVDFITARSGYAIDTDGRAFKTANAGRTWRELPGVGGTDPVGLAFADAQSGWALLERFGSAAAGGYVLRTDDGGASWRPQLISQQPLTGGVYGEPFLVATSATGAIALAGGTGESDQRPLARLFATRSGGDAGADSVLTLSASSRAVRRERPVTIRGRLAPAEGGETATIFARSAGRTSWEEIPLRVASNGTFSVTRRLRRSTQFVAQWQGDDDRRSDGTKVLTVRVRR